MRLFGFLHARGVPVGRKVALLLFAAGGGLALAACSGTGQASGREGGPGPTPEARPAAETGTVQAGPFELSYIVEGTGRPTIVVGSARYYQRTFSANLRNHLRLVFMDHRGYVPSPGPVDTTAFALDTLIADIERVRRQLDLGRVVIVGHSGHAYMALEYAKRYPEHVSHVVMVGISPDLSAASTRARDRYWDEFASAERKAILEENVRRLPNEEIASMPVSRGQRFIATYVRNGPQAWYDPHFDSTPFWEGVDVNMDMIDYVWGRIFRDIDITRGLDGFDRPVFLALGRYDFLIAPPSAWDPVLPAFRDATVRVFEQSGHTPFYEEAELFDRELLAWMERASASTGAGPADEATTRALRIDEAKGVIASHEDYARMGDLDLIMTNVHPEVVVLTADAPLVQGAESFRELYAGLLSAGAWDFTHEYRGSGVVGDVVELFGVARGTLTPPGDAPTAFANNFLLQLRPDESGRLKVWRASFAPTASVPDGPPDTSDLQ